MPSQSGAGCHRRARGDEPSSDRSTAAAVERDPAHAVAHEPDELDDPRRARIAFIETLGVSPVQEARRRNAHRLFAQYFAALVRADFNSEGFGGREEDIFAVALVGAINEILSDWVLRADKPPLDDLIDPIVDIIGLMSDGVRGIPFDRPGGRLL